MVVALWFLWCLFYCAWFAGLVDLLSVVISGGCGTLSVVVLWCLLCVIVGGLRVFVGVLRCLVFGLIWWFWFVILVVLVLVLPFYLFCCFVWCFVSDCYFWFCDLIVYFN